ncbi:6-pyruvoyl trahydropterin synthase family protein [Nonlabens xiamenensis]|uniref:6-pyruvoyl trahydropterin synthase family protein n=1 Tax=Nonlabens xiamenensis TaxID=2341043 RepID=UPI000F60EFE7|nr:6-carboxytetrahydropterin synthase [Nonlabens xiamenensis]
MRLTAYRKAHFNAAHRLYRNDWSDEKNEQVFGKCSNPHYHGHNYNLEVGVTGNVDPETGYLIDLKILKDLIKNEVEDYLDHKNLNEQVSEFQELNPTVEHIAYVIYNRIRKHLDNKYDLEVKLFETDRNFVIYRGE